MKGLERISSVRLAEILSQSDLLPNDQISEALYEQDSTGISFVEVLIENGEIAEWEIAKVVVKHFQLPYLDVEHFDINPNAVKCLPEDFLLESRILPLDLQGSVLTVAMPVMTPFKILSQAQSLCAKDIFPVVGLATANLQMLLKIFPNRAKSSAARKRVRKQDASNAWENIFDLGDEQVLKDLNP
ncbi:MAG: hypothetical protein ACE5F1_17960 [Planctomycetota bacterium]